MRESAERIDGFRSGKNLGDEEGAGDVPGPADRGPYSESELPRRSVDPDLRHRAEIRPMLLQRFHPDKNLIYRPGEIPTDEMSVLR